LTDEAHRRAEALFKKEQQLHEAQQAMAEYQAELRAMREKTARLRALRLARDGRRSPQRNWNFVVTHLIARVASEGNTPDSAAEKFGL
jgi:hypothetical protein